MAWTAPRTWVAGEDVGFALMNTHIRDNLLETAPGIASAGSRLIVTDGANSIVERIPATANVVTQETTASTTFTDLATAGPSVTVTTGTLVYIMFTVESFNTGAGGENVVGYAVSGASALGASATRALKLTSSAASDKIQVGWGEVRAVTAGSNTFKLQYLVSSGTGTFLRRRISVIPF